MAKTKLPVLNSGDPASGADDSPRTRLDELRSRLEGRRGPTYWRSLEELAGSPELEEAIREEFPRHADIWPDGFDRRRFLQLSSASMALAGLAACTKQPPESIVPYVKAPEDLVPGKPLFFATGSLHGGYVRGLLAESHMGRPTKVEGNPEHPGSLGGTDLHAQASVLDLYDPDRSAAVTELGRIRTWASFVSEIGGLAAGFEGIGGEGLRILMGANTSPTVAGLLAELAEKMPSAKLHRWEPAGRDQVHAGARLAFGEDVDTRYDLTRADVVLAVDGDFLNEGPGAVRYSKDFASRRRVRDGSEKMSRLYSLESTPTALSSVADHRLGVKPSELPGVFAALAAALGVPGVAAPSGAGHGEWVAAVAEDLAEHRGSSAVMPGEYADPAVHALAHAINHHLGNVGSTVVHLDPVEIDPSDSVESLRELVTALEAGEVDTLVVLDTNVAWNAPADLGVAAALQKARIRVHLGATRDETAEFCQWHVPMAHSLESWWDGRAFDGTASFGQPLVEPLYDGKTVEEVLAVLLGRGGLSAEELVQEHWKKERGELGFTKWWRRSLHDGLVADSAFPDREVTIDGGAIAAAVAEAASKTGDGLEIVFRPDPTVGDGRFTNNGWLQECPKPITKLTWDNALLMSPKTARELNVPDPMEHGDQRGDAPLVMLAGAGEGRLRVPVWLVPGHPDGVATIHLGYGREKAGRVGDGTGFDAGILRTSDSMWAVTRGGGITPVKGTYLLASTQDHHSMEGRDIVAMGTLDDVHHDPSHITPHHHVDTSLSIMPGDEWEYDGHKWGMSIDLTTCTGCNACLVACQSENNIPTVGKDQVAAGRELHWIRLDRYFTGDADSVGEFLNQPVPCMQCEQAPCEVVCPVGATVHSDEGLNDMVYNRCVGTRYCSNNCPYKVRRFNFFLYSDLETPSLQLGRNPDVTVRTRGVMEKCTYCVQRINHARIDAKREDRRIRDGEVTTACQQACPSDAIVFGDLNDPASAVNAAKASELDYSLLEELGNRPRTTYLARIRNPNPKLAGGGGHGAGYGDDHSEDGHA